MDNEMARRPAVISSRPAVISRSWLHQTRMSWLWTMRWPGGQLISRSQLDTVRWPGCYL